MSLMRFLSISAIALGLSACSSPTATYLPPVPLYAEIEAQSPPTGDLPNFAKVHDFFYRGGVPTEEGLKTLQKKGIKTVISFQNFKFKNEKDVIAWESEKLKEMGIKFVHLPMYTHIPPSEKMIKTFFDTVNDPKSQPVYAHCKVGRDRTGAMIAAYRIRFDGFTAERAIAEMETFEFVQKDYPAFVTFVKGFK